MQSQFGGTEADTKEQVKVPRFPIIPRTLLQNQKTLLWSDNVSLNIYETWKIRNSQTNAWKKSSYKMLNWRVERSHVDSLNHQPHQTKKKKEKGKWKKISSTTKLKNFSNCGMPQEDKNYIKIFCFLTWGIYNFGKIWVHVRISLVF